MSTVLLLHGPNLNLLGEREPHLYGSTTLPEVEESVRSLVEKSGHAFRCFQSNSEGDLVGWVQDNRSADFLIVNAGALTHTSVALRDALKLTGLPFIELHISNVHAREPFRHHSYLSDIAVGLMVGLGTRSYPLAAQWALDYLKDPS